MKSLATLEAVVHQIYVIRGHRIMLDRDLAELYGVPTKVLIQSVKRNIERFPADFMFLLTWGEVNSLRSQIVTLKPAGKRGAHTKYLPRAFTEQGVAMLSSVLRSERAIRVNILIMRAFVKIRQAIASNRDLAEKYNELERRTARHDNEIRAIFDVIKKLIAPPDKPKERIGFYKK